LSGPGVGVDPTADGAPARTRASSPEVERVGRVVFVLLVVACFVAFFVTQRLKHTPTAVQNFKMTPFFVPSSAGPPEQEAISFKLAQADGVTVTVTDAKGDVVATLLRDHPVVRYKQLSLRWNGHEGTARRYGRLVSATGRTAILVPRNRGPLAPPGEYRVEVRLRRLDRTVRSPQSFTLEAR
jgi:hypothetical protein